MAPSMLFVVNDPIATEATLGEAFANRGFDVSTFDVVPAHRVSKPAVDVQFPDPSRYDAIVLLGARWSVYDEALQRSWIPNEVQFVHQADRAGVPLLGVCFGGQLVAHAHGGSVTSCPNPEVGWTHIDSQDDSLIPPGEWFQWHFDQWTLPPAATEIARNPSASQAFLLRRTLAVQFHPEIDAALLAGWLEYDRDEVLEAGVDPDEMLGRTAQLKDLAATRVRTLVDGFLSRVAPRQ